MPIMTHSELRIDEDAVLRGQNADPTGIRARRPLLLNYARDAMARGQELIKPQIVWARADIHDWEPGKVILSGGFSLTGEEIARLLAQAHYVIAAVCTIGPDLEQRSGMLLQHDIVSGLALEGYGSAAVEALANWACRNWETETAKDGLQTTVPLNPGMTGWPLEVAQSEIFAILQEPDMPVTLVDHTVMQPAKSLSMLLGVGKAIRQEGVVCDTCQFRETCAYRIKSEDIAILK